MLINTSAKVLALVDYNGYFSKLHPADYSSDTTRLTRKKTLYD